MDEDHVMNANGEAIQHQNTAGTKVQTLFGGAFKIDKFPETLRDISDIVPIGDNQEIFSDVNELNPAYSGNQLIIEILQKIDKPDAEALSFHF